MSLSLSKTFIYSRALFSNMIDCQCRLCLSPIIPTYEFAQKSYSGTADEFANIAVPKLQRLSMVCIDCLCLFRRINPNVLCRHCLSNEPILKQNGLCNFCTDGAMAAVHQCFAPWSYEHPLDKLIIHAKSYPDYALAHYAAVAMAESTQIAINNSRDSIFAAPQLSWLSGINAIVPMPMFKRNMIMRGYNQSLLLARALARVWSQQTPPISIPVKHKWVHKIRDTGSQKELNRNARFRSLKNAFVAEACVKDKNIVLVDDVMTTGASISELSNALKKAGAKTIIAMVFARTHF